MSIEYVLVARPISSDHSSRSSCHINTKYETWQKYANLSLLDILQTANCRRYKVLLCSNPASGSTFLFNKTTKSWHFQQASLYLCFLFCTPESHFCCSLWNLYREIKVGWPLAGPGFISSCVTVQSRHLQIRPRSQSSKHMFQIFHTHTLYLKLTLLRGIFSISKVFPSLFQWIFSSNDHIMKVIMKQDFE